MKTVKLVPLPKNLWQSFKLAWTLVLTGWKSRRFGSFLILEKNNHVQKD